MQRALLLLLVAASYLLLAGARPWTLGPLVVLAVLAALAAPRSTAMFPAEYRRLDLSLIALALAISLQLLPLPATVINLTSPNHAAVSAALRFDIGPPPTWAALSLDPERTTGALATVILGILAFWTARAVFGVPGNTRAFCRALALIAAVAAIAAIIQRAATPRLILFAVPPEARSAAPFGAFTNRNHFATWLLLTATPVIGYLIARLRIHEYRDRRIRSVIRQFLASGAVMTAMSAVVTVGVMLVTLSRSALAGLGVAALTGWRVGRPRMRFERTMLPTHLGILGVVMILTMAFIDVDGWATRIEEGFTTDGRFGRLTIWKETLPIIREFWLTGAGAGTYGEAMTYYQQTRFFVGSMQRWAHFNNAHSHYVQLAAEGGLLLTVPAMVALAALWTVARRALRADKGEMFWVRVGAAAGLAGLAAQSIWEVSLTMPANAVLAGVLAGLLLYRREAARADTLTPDPLMPSPARTHAG